VTSRDIKSSVSGPPVSAVGSRGVRCAADERLEAGEQLREGEGLGEVIVAAGLESFHAVVHAGAGAEDEHWHPRAFGPQRAHHAEPVELRQHEVEHDGVVVHRAGQRQAALAVGSMVHGKAVLLQPAGDEGGKLRIVLDDQDAHGRCRRDECGDQFCGQP
jgi:hypothetical protein